jgi:ribosomal protein L16 Arg81 hydroxylase
MNFDDLIHPLTDHVFIETIKGKKPVVIRGNPHKKYFFKDICDWNDISKYVSNDRAVAGLQMILPNGEKLCMEKANLHRDQPSSWAKKDRYEKKYVKEIWDKGGSMILTKASMFSPNISAIGNAIEKRFPNVSADAHFYCSPTKNAVSFECHADADDNYLVHAIGEVHWKVYNVFARSEITESGRRRITSRSTMPVEEEKKHTPVIDTVLTVGDLLYIPAGMFHRATPASARVSISVPVAESKSERPIDRNWYDFEKNNS